MRSIKLGHAIKEAENHELEDKEVIEMVSPTEPR